MRPHETDGSEFGTLVRGLKRFFLVAGTFSFFINALMLVPSIVSAPQTPSFPEPATL